MIEEYSFKSRISALKIVKVGDFVKNLAWDHGLRCETEIDKGWLRETVRFEVFGTFAEVSGFKDDSEIRRLKPLLYTYWR